MKNYRVIKLITNNLMKEIRSVKLTRKIIEDKEMVQLKNLNTEIENINRKEIDDLESDESESDERYQRKVRYYLKVCKSLQKDIMMI